MANSCWSSSLLDGSVLSNPAKCWEASATTVSGKSSGIWYVRNTCVHTRFVPLFAENVEAWIITGYCKLSFLTFAKEVMHFPLCVCLSVCLSVSRITKKLSTIFWLFDFFWTVGCVISSSWLGFGDDPDRGANTGIFKRNFYRFGIGTIQRIFPITQEVVNELLRNFPRGGVSQ